MSKISGVVIAKNEEDMIADCLRSLSFCDEIIVIDGGSEDNTVVLAEKEGAKVFKHLSKDFSEARNFALKKTSGDWIFYIDADERVTPLLRDEIKSQIKKDEISAYKIKRKNFYLGDNEWPYVEKIERLFYKEKLKGWQGKLHESPIIEGDVDDLQGFLLHYSHRNLEDMLNKTIEWSETEAELRFKSGHPKMVWWRFFRVMFSAFIDSYLKQGGWKAGSMGLIESLYQSFSIFVTYARLWEMQENIKNTTSSAKRSEQNAKN